MERVDLRFLLCWTFLSANLRFSVSEDPVIVTAGRGQTVNLTCQAPSNIEVLAVKLTRPDLEPEYVYFYRDTQCDPEHQHPDFIDRVELKDKQMKDGDVTLLLKDSRVNDTGTYECDIICRERDRTKRINSRISLNVTVSGGAAGHTGDGGDKGGGDKDGGKTFESRLYIGLISGLLVAVMMMIVFILIKIIQRRRKDSHLGSPYQPCKKPLV